MDKRELRRQCVAERRTISDEELDGASRRIAAHFFSGFDLENVHFLHSFLPIEKFKEINTRFIFAKLWRDFPNVQTVVPRVDFETDSLCSLKFTHETELVRNTWDIDEPAHEDFVEPELIDVVLVPGLCFDHSGHRVGYGKGYYDRFLTACRPDCVKIGLSYFDLIEKIDDIHAGDVPLDFMITPGGVIVNRK